MMKALPFTLAFVLLLLSATGGLANDVDPNEPEPTAPQAPPDSICRDKSYAPADKGQPYRAWKDYEQKGVVDDTKYLDGKASWNDALSDTSIKAIKYTRKDPEDDKEKTYLAYFTYIRRGKIKRRIRHKQARGLNAEDDVETYRHVYVTVYELTKERRLAAPTSRALETCSADDVGLPLYIDIFGDPHIRDWSGNSYDFQGECDLVFLYAPKFDGKRDLNIHVRTSIRYDYSYIESAALQIGDDILEVSSFGETFLNGVNTAGDTVQGMSLSGFKIRYEEESKKKHSYSVELGNEQYIELSAYKDLVSIQIDTTGQDVGHWFGNSTGLLGSMDGTWLARDGEAVINDPAAMGQEWQVLDSEPMLFQSIRDPQYPKKCNFPIAASAETRRKLLGGTMVSREEAAKSCAKWGDNQELCIRDVLALNDIGMADAGPY